MVFNTYLSIIKEKRKGYYMEYEEFKKKLEINNLSLKEFANLSGVKYGTCVRWGKDKRPVSDWVESWINLYEEKNRLKKEVDRHIAFKQEFYEMMNGQTITVR